ncbi:MAG: ATP-grasp domain-containing protein [Candidatus Odinarchaeota archaeon]
MVYEHASGGGYCDKAMTPSLFSEGYAMLNSSVRDFQRIESKVYTTLDYRIANFTPPLNVEIVTILRPPQKIINIFDKVCKEIDQIMIIAPESADTLYNLTKIAERNQLIVLGSTSEAVKLLSNKWDVKRVAENLGLNTPFIEKIPFNKSLQEIKEILDNLGYPAVLRTPDSVGGEGIILINPNSDLKTAVAKLKASTMHNEFLAHKYIKGIPASVSLISNGISATPISLNAQAVSFDRDTGELNYIGGYTPLKYKTSKQIKKTAQKLVENMSGVRGYIGVDLVIDEQDTPFILEVNPRLTTSYIALRRIADVNLMEALRRAVIDGALPETINLKRYAFYSKVKIKVTEALTITRMQELAQTSGIITPPFPTGLDYSEAMIVSDGNTLKEAQNAFEYMKNSLEALGVSGSEGV